MKHSSVGFLRFPCMDWLKTLASGYHYGNKLRMLWCPHCVFSHGQLCSIISTLAFSTIILVLVLGFNSYIMDRTPTLVKESIYKSPKFEGYFSFTGASWMEVKLIFLSWATSCFGSLSVLWFYRAVDTFSSGKLGEPSGLQAGSTSETKLGQEPHCTGHYLSRVLSTLRTTYSSLTIIVAKESKFETGICV